MPRDIELLAPAASLDVGRVALSAGADAVYIGAPRFGARSAAGVSMEDIGTLAFEAHSVGAKLYVALNTILTDSELREAVEIIRQLYKVGVDALIVQDMGLLMQDLPPIPLHASTQCHSDSHDKLILLQQLGIEQVVLPREVSTSDLPELLEGIHMRIESFVHGALCVSYSGRCFISEACRGRSANRGSCAQYCRMSYDLEDADGNKVITSQHLLSLRDLNRSEILDELLAEGVSSLKIEGRLKGVDYVRNVTAHYRERLDKIIADNSREYGRAYRRASWGEEQYLFTPHVERTFSRLYTNYNTPLHQPIPVESITPFTNKSVGEEVGMLLEGSGKEVLLRLKGEDMELANGDGLLFVSPDHKETSGALVNQVSRLPQGSLRVKLSSAVTLPKGARVYRNLNHQLDQVLARPDASRRKVAINMVCRCSQTGIEMEAIIAERTDIKAVVRREMALEEAKKDNSDYLKNTLAKLGNTPYVAKEVNLELVGRYIPPSVLTDLRRELIERLQEECHTAFVRDRDERGRELQRKRQAFLAEEHEAEEFGIPQDLDFTYNVANSVAEAFYRQIGVKGDIAPAMEVSMPEGAVPVMFTRHCLMHQIGYCTRDGKKAPFRLPLYLVRGKEHFRVSTDCRNCRMTLWKEE